MKLHLLVMPIKHSKLQNEIILSQIHNLKVYLCFYCDSNNVGLGLKYQVLAFRWDSCFLTSIVAQQKGFHLCFIIKCLKA